MICSCGFVGCWITGWVQAGPKVPGDHVRAAADHGAVGRLQAVHRHHRAVHACAMPAARSALMPAAVYEGKASWGQVLPRWAVVYAGAPSALRPAAHANSLPQWWRPHAHTLHVHIPGAASSCVWPSQARQRVRGRWRMHGCVRVLHGGLTRAPARASSRLVCPCAGNFVGCLLTVAAVVSTGLLASNPVLPAIAVAKTSIPLGQVGPAAS